ncbi:hypothetical protein NEMBOFW57_007077 [Staphylotrichum longicolle]|uniref:NB-ARC domain-containing protein n=1 Tax=Staphylotrichum longicolle TaxID=669026 RepID=A0AAD4HYP7_9PEZI|nr:hypothetical protein NEMBOFW57_007077 [Staphylotrichum longicolle]
MHSQSQLRALPHRDCDDLSEANGSALATFADDFTRQNIQNYARDDFPTLFEGLLHDINGPAVRAKLRDNRASFGGTLEVSQLVEQRLAFTSLLGGFLYMAIHRAVRQAEQSARSEECFHAIIDKLRRCSELGNLFASRCSDCRISEQHANERLSQAYRLQLAFLGAIIDSFDQGPLVSLNDDRWKTIQRREAECNDYLQASEHFLFDILKSNTPHLSSSPPPTGQTAPPTPSVYMLPKQPARFYGRDRELESISQSLSEHNTVTIRGIAGVGKTSIALRFAHQSLSDYSVIVWMRSELTAGLDQSCHEALSRFGLVGETEKPGVEIRQKWRDHLAQAAFRWLVIFDNVERSEDLDQFWPPGGNGKIIVTTRHPGIGFNLTDDEIAISPFTPAEGRKCILSLATWPGGVHPDPEAAEELSRELGGLALGIVHMTALMRARKTPIKRFLNDYRRNKVKYHSKPAGKSLGIYPNTKPEIGTNWTMTFNSLNGDARSLLDIEEALMDLALVDKDPDTEMLSLHRLEQLQVHVTHFHQFEHYLDPASRQTAFEQASKLLYEVFPKTHTGQRFTGKWNDCAMYIQHVIILDTHYIEEGGALSAPSEFATLMGWASWYLWEIADFENFQRVQSGGIKAYKGVPPGTFDEAAWGLLNYNGGTVETSMGMFDKAMVSLDEALRVRRKLGNDDDIAATLNNMGMLYSSMHQFDIAERHWKEALQIHMARAPTQDRNLSLTMVKHNLQRNAIHSGKVDNFPSVQDLQATVAFFESTISWWMTGHAYLVLGNLMFVLKRWDDAAKAYQKATHTLQAPGRAGKQPAVAMMIYKSGCVAYELADYTSAAKLFRESIAISSLYPAIPAEHARTQFMLVQALRQGGRPETPDEEARAEQMVASLMQRYYASIGRVDFTPCTKVSDFDAFITAKYQ